MKIIYLNKPSEAVITRTILGLHRMAVENAAAQAKATPADTEAAPTPAKVTADAQD